MWRYNGQKTCHFISFSGYSYQRVDNCGLRAEASTSANTIPCSISISISSTVTISVTSTNASSAGAGNQMDCPG